MEPTSSARESPRAQLQQSLRGFQIFFIVVSSIIGTGVFTGNGTALELAGPGGLIVTVVILGVFAVFVGETISEFVQMFPTSNAVFEYVKAFVDEELAWVIVLLYWYTFASVFATHMLGAASLLGYWEPATVWPPLAFYGIVPWILFAINLSGVRVFGWIETVGGALKVVLVFGVTCVLYDIATTENAGSITGPINDGFQFKPQYSTNTARGFCYGLPAVAYGYLGIDTVIVAAFEAKTVKDIAWPSRVIHWVIFGLYLLCTFGIALTVRWNNPQLPSIPGGLPSQTVVGSAAPQSDSAVILAMYYSDYAHLTGFINGCLIFSIISAANTSLYVASRVLYGMTYKLQGRNSLSRRLKGVSKLWYTTKVPAMALLISVVAFYWLPWLTLAQSATIEDFIQVISLTSSMSVLIVWFTLCFAFHRYEKWTRLCADGLRAHHMDRFDRESIEYKERVKNVLSWFQPWTARLGMCGCFLVFIAASASWWDTPSSVVTVLSAYGAHIVALALWLILKIYKGITTGVWTKWWVRMEVEHNPKDLKNRLRDLEFLSHKNELRDAAAREPGVGETQTDSTRANEKRTVEPREPPPRQPGSPPYDNSYGRGCGRVQGSIHGSGYGSGFMANSD